MSCFGILLSPNVLNKYSSSTGHTQSLVFVSDSKSTEKGLLSLKTLGSITSPPGRRRDMTCVSLRVSSSRAEVHQTCDVRSRPETRSLRAPPESEPTSGVRSFVCGNETAPYKFFVSGTIPQVPLCVSSSFPEEILSPDLSRSSSSVKTFLDVQMSAWWDLRGLK